MSPLASNFKLFPDRPTFTLVVALNWRLTAIGKRWTKFQRVQPHFGQGFDMVQILLGFNSTWNRKHLETEDSSSPIWLFYMKICLILINMIFACKLSSRILTFSITLISNIDLYQITKNRTFFKTYSLNTKVRENLHHNIVLNFYTLCWTYIN